MGYALRGMVRRWDVGVEGRRMRDEGVMAIW